MILISLFAIYALAFALRNLDGPWNLFSRGRNKLMMSESIGNFCYELLSCPWCFGFHCGWVVYLLQLGAFSWQCCALWALAGSTIVAFGDVVYDRFATTVIPPAPIPPISS